MDLHQRPLYVPILKSNQLTSFAPDYEVQVHKLVIFNNKIKSLNSKRYFPQTLLEKEESFDFKITLLPDRQDLIETMILIPLKIRHKNHSADAFDYILQVPFKIEIVKNQYSIDEIPRIDINVN